MEEPNRYQRIKQHLKDNKKAYIIGTGVSTGCFAVGYFLPPQVVNVVDAFNFKYKSPTTTNVTTVVLAKRACPNPIPVRDKLTGESYGSLRRAVEVTGVSLTKITKDALGPQERFERLPDSVLA